MRIKIAQRFRPFSHIPGTKCLLPGTCLCFEVFPALVKIWDLSIASLNAFAEIPLPIEAPLDEFTVQQDLEKGSILIWGKSQKKFERFLIGRTEKAVEIISGKGEKIVVPFKNPIQTHPITSERLSLGNNKSQDWVQVESRSDLAEIFPLWLRLGQSTPVVEAFHSSPSLLAICSDTEQPYRDFLNLYKAGFEGILIPRSKDHQYQGFPFDPIPENVNPLTILTEGAGLIRSLFVRQNDKGIDILPQLPQQFHCGRMIGVQLRGIGILDFEWSKKQIRKVILASSAEAPIRFNFGKKISTMRLSQVSQTKGSRISTCSSIDIHPGESYLFDRFEH